MNVAANVVAGRSYSSADVLTCSARPRPDERDPVPQRHRLHLIVRDVEHVGAEPGEQLRQLDAHASAELRVEVGEWLVEQEERSAPDDGATDRDALALAARKCARLPGEKLRDAAQLGRLFDACGDRPGRRASHTLR